MSRWLGILVFAQHVDNCLFIVWCMLGILLSCVHSRTQVNFICEFYLEIWYQVPCIDFGWSASSMYSMMVHEILMFIQHDHDETKHPLSYEWGG